MSKILCIIDGMTDPGFRAQTMTNLSSMRLEGYVDTTRGQEAESLGCILRLLGVKKIPTHLRGYAEALGNDIPVGANDLILRGSWVALDAQGRCSTVVEAPEEILPIAGCRYYALGQYKSLLVFPGLASFVTDLQTHPPYAFDGLAAQQMCPQGCKKVEEVFQKLCSSERCLVPWGQAVAVQLPPFGGKGAVACGTPIVKGIGRLLNMEVLAVPGATGDTDTDLMEKGKAALRAAEKYPFVLLHINGADEAAHRKNAQQKQAFLQQVDDVVLTMLLRSYHDVYVVSDHGTDPKTGKHLSQKQPMYTNVPEITAKKTSLSPTKAPQTDSVQTQRRHWAVEMLKTKAKLLGRLPQKGDFDEIDKIKIKQALGPWPRALEQAGLKPPKDRKKP